MALPLQHTCAACCAAALCLAALAGAPAAFAVDQSAQLSSSQEFASHDVFHSVDSRRYYLADGDGAITHASAAKASPWKVSVDTSVDGPAVPLDEIDGAKGLVRVHVRVEPADTRYSGQLRTFAAFTIPTDSCTDITADDGVSVTAQGNDTLIAATADPGQALDFHVYATATDFDMTPLTVAALAAASPGAYAAGLRGLADRSGQLTASLGTATDGAQVTRHRELIDTLTKLRDQERSLAASTTKTRTQAHECAFRAYMAAYVGSYTTHLSGSIGSKTQMTALMGTAGELKGDTPLAHAVTDLAAAVNSLSDAHQHAGAADEVDRIITRIRQQGTAGLAEELKQTAGEQTRLGSEQYSRGQSQLTAAMVPYSMAYTDVYTARLSDLAGNDVAAAAAHRDAAVAATNAAEGTDAALKKDKQGVDAAMATLAAAREHTGAGSAAKQVLRRFADRFDGGDGSDATAASASAGAPRIMQEAAAWRETHTLGGQARTALQRQVTTLRGQEGAGRGEDDMSSLVDDSSDGNAAADVAKYAGKFTGGSAADAAQDDGNPSATSPSTMAPSDLLAMRLDFAGVGDHSVFRPSNAQLVDETTAIASHATVLRALADTLEHTDWGSRVTGMPAGEAKVLTTRFVITAS